VPSILRKALEHWDAGGDWLLPPGTYYLLPIEYGRSHLQRSYNVISNGVRRVERMIVRGIPKEKALDTLRLGKAARNTISARVGRVRKVKGRYITIRRIQVDADRIRKVYHPGNKERRHNTDYRLIDLANMRNRWKRNA
jgi:hypothetical protein